MNREQWDLKKDKANSMASARDHVPRGVTGRGNSGGGHPDLTDFAVAGTSFTGPHDQLYFDWAWPTQE
jgi:hypothetical protein